MVARHQAKATSFTLAAIALLLTRIGVSKLHFPGTSCLLLRGAKLGK